MQFSSVLIALLATGVAALPGGGGGYPTPVCHTTSTCKAYQTTYPSVYKSEVTVTKTKTVYKPETITKEVPKTVTKTKYHVTTKTKTKVIEETKTIPVKTKTYKTICYTKPVYIWTHTTSVCDVTKTWPYVVTDSYVKTYTTETPSVYTTETPCPETYVTSYEKDCTETKTKHYTKCHTSSKCHKPSPPSYPTPTHY